jgi:hypothetical protein
MTNRLVAPHELPVRLNFGSRPAAVKHRIGKHRTPSMAKCSALMYRHTELSVCQPRRPAPATLESSVSIPHPTPTVDLQRRRRRRCAPGRCIIETQRRRCQRCWSNKMEGKVEHTIGEHIRRKTTGSTKRQFHETDCEVLQAYLSIGLSNRESSP